MAAPEPPWTAHRRRARALAERYPHAAQVLGVYLALLDVWDEAWHACRAERPEPGQLSAWAAARVTPRVVKATEATGPEALAAAVTDLADPEAALTGWLAGADAAPVERYVARASLFGPLVALGDDAAAACVQESTGDERHCPRCGGPPQLSWRGQSGEALVSAQRMLQCARCGHDWAYTGSACPSCGETTGSKRTVYAERREGVAVGASTEDSSTEDGAGVLPHLRVDACATCERYLIDVDLGRDPRAVPEVDELVAVPLDLYATEHGLSKITPNLMGF